MGGQIAGSKSQPDNEPPLATRATRRLRHWSDGLIIGSKRFVRQLADALLHSADEVIEIVEVIEVIDASTTSPTSIRSTTSISA